MAGEQGVGTWPVTAEDVLTGLADWRAAHPRATLQEIERTLDERLAVRRGTERAGAAYVAVQTAAVERIERELPAPPPGPTVQYLSVDGAMVPLVGGVWAEGRTLARGTVVGREVQMRRDRERTVHAEDLSHFSRLTDHETVARRATVETQRRGTETAGGCARWRTERPGSRTLWRCTGRTRCASWIGRTRWATGRGWGRRSTGRSRLRRRRGWRGSGARCWRRRRAPAWCGRRCGASGRRWSPWPRERKVRWSGW